MTYAAYRDRDVYLGPVTRSFAITPSDTANLAEIPRKVVASGSGNINAILAGDSDDPNYLTGGYTLQAGAASHAASKVKLTLVDTTPSVVAGNVYVTGTVNGNENVTEVVAFTGAAVKETYQLFTKVVAVKSDGFTVLGGGGDETLAAEWSTGGQAIVNASNVANQSILPTSPTVYALTANVPADLAVKRVLSTSTTATGIKGLI